MEDIHYKENSYQLNSSFDHSNGLIISGEEDRPSSRCSSTTSSRLTREEVSFMNNEELDDFCKQIFNMCDTNGDGYITQDELITQCESDDPVLIANLLQSLDLNNDGKISFDEFRSGLQIISQQLMEEDDEEFSSQSTPYNNRDITVTGGEYLNGSVYESDVTNSEKEEAWVNTMTRIDPSGLLSNNKDVRTMWLELYSGDHSLLEHFEGFLFNVVTDLEKSQSDVEHIQNKIKKLLSEQSREAYEMDGLLQEQLTAAYDKQEKKSQEVSERISTHYQELLEQREAMIVSLSEKEATLRHVLEEKTQTEQELRKERLELLTLNQSLQNQLSDSYKQLSASQRQLQRISETYNEREQLPWSPGEDPLVETSLLSNMSYSIGSPRSPSHSPGASLTVTAIPPTLRTSFSFNSSSLAVEVEEAMKLTETPTRQEDTPPCITPTHQEDTPPCVTPTHQEDTPTPTPPPEIEETQSLLTNEMKHSIDDSSLFNNKLIKGDSLPVATPIHFPSSDQATFTVSQLVPPRDTQSHNNSAATPSRVFKVVILGDSGVGKTSLIRRLATPTGDIATPRSTLGLDYSTALLNVGEDTVVFQLWDTAGQERFHSTTAVYFKRADAFIIVYDVTNRLTFNAIKSWVTLIKTTLRSDLPVLMVMGNKSDCDRERQVSREDGQEIALELRGLFSETSARSGDNVIQAHTTLASLLLERENQDMENIRQSALRLNKLEQRKRCKC